MAIGTLSQVLSRDRSLISSIVLSLGILSILASYLVVSLDRLYKVSTHTFPWIRCPWNTLSESYNGIRALADLFRVSLKYPTSFRAPLPRSGCCIYLRTLWSSYIFLFFFISTSAPCIMDQPTILCFSTPKREILWATSFRAPNSHTWLWNPFQIYH
jgi:hypothetical protein